MLNESNAKVRSYLTNSIKKANAKDISKQNNKVTKSADKNMIR